MPAPAAERQFFFTAVSAAGQRKMGVRAAPSRAELASELSAERLLLLRAWEMPAWAAGETPDVSLRDQLNLNEQLALLVDRGVPLVEALEVAGSVVSPKAQARIKQLRENVSAGASFADACEQVGGFDDIAVSVYRAAERSGDLAPAAKRLAEAARRRSEIAIKARTMLIYPIVVGVVSVVVLALLVMLVLPTVGRAIVQQAEASPAGQSAVPGFSLFMINLGLWSRDNWMWVLLAAGALIVLFIALRRALLPAIGRLLRKIPLVDRAAMTTEVARFFAILAAMVRSGVTLADSLAVATDAVRHPRLRAQLERLQKDLVEGGVLSTLLERIDALPLSTRRLLIAADRAGDLEPTLDALADEYADRSDENTSRLVALLGPLILIVMFLFVAAVVLSLMIPLLNFSRMVG